MLQGGILVAETVAGTFFSFLIILTIIVVVGNLRKKRLFSSFGRTV